MQSAKCTFRANATLAQPHCHFGRSCHGCQMAIARILDHMYLALWASGLWLHYATLQNLISFFPWIAAPALHPGAILGKEGI